MRSRIGGYVCFVAVPAPGYRRAMTIPTLAAECSTVEVVGNRLDLYVESAPFLAALIDDIRRARHRVWVESYTVADDAAGRAVAEALKERAAAGIDCRLLYDTVGSLTTPERYFAELREAGVAVRAYRPFGSWLYRFRSARYLWRWHRRDHRKLVVIDDDVSYFGGMNIVDQGGSAVPPRFESKHPTAQEAWRDVHVRLTGAQTAEIAASWDDLWSRLHRRPRRERRNPTVKEIRSCTQDAIFFFDSRPHVKHRRPGRLIRRLIRGARRDITLAMAYFLPFGGMLRELLRARRRGVTVQVIVPHKNDVRLVQWAARHIYEKLLRHGVRIYERRDQMLHSKVMIIDGAWSVIGSCNFDPRSMLLNLEFFAVVRSAELAGALASICRYERRQSDPVRLSKHRRRAWWERLLHRAAWTFRRWL